MTSAAPHRGRARLARLLPRTAARQLAATLALGALGAGLVFLASRPAWAHVRTVPPRPLPASSVAVTGAAMVPYAGALVLAGLATLAAILATRGLPRRLAGGLLAVLGAALAAAVFTISAGAAVSAAAASAGPAQAAAGSVTGGGSRAAPAVPDIAGTAPHVTLAAAGWQAMAVAGALAMIAAGVLVMCRARALAVMPGRYDAPPGTAAAARPRRAARGGPDASGGARDSADMWEALSRGQDPTETARPAGS